MSFKKRSKGKQKRVARQRQDERGTVELKQVANVGINTVWRTPLGFRESDDQPSANAKLSDLLKVLINNMRALKGKPLLADDGHALDVADSILDAKDGAILLTSATYTWLLTLLRDQGPILFSPNTSLIVKALEAAQTVTPTEVAVKPE